MKQTKGPTLAAVKERIRRHQLGLEQMRSGQLFQAFETLVETLNRFGPHVGLLSDLAAVLYLLGRVEDCLQMTFRLHQELTENQSLISEASQAKTLIFLGKMFEEQGHVHRALENYSDAARTAQSEDSIRIRAQAQLLRLQSFLGLRKKLSELYQICIRNRSESKHLVIELEHALILAELELFGPQSAESRLETLFSEYGKEFSSQDRNLCLADFAEELLRRNQPSSLFQSWIHQACLNDADEFERLVFLLMKSQSFALSVPDLGKLLKKLHFMGSLRALVLARMRNTDPQFQEECRRKFFFFLESLPTESQKLLLKKWENEFRPETLLFWIDESRHEISSSQNPRQVMAFKKSSFATKALSWLASSQDNALQDFIQDVFEVAWDMTSFDRARMAIARLNKDLAPMTGVAKTILITKTTVDLAAGLQFRIRDEK